MREFRRFLDSFVLYTNNPKEIELLKQKEDLFQSLCTYTTAAIGDQKCIGMEFLFKLPGGQINTLVGARKYIERQLKEWKCNP